MLRRVKSWFVGEEEPPPPPPPPLSPPPPPAPEPVTTRVGQETYTFLAAGEALSFTVKAHYHWHIRGTADERAIAWMLDYWRQRDGVRILRLLRETMRSHGPEDSTAAEHAANHSLLILSSELGTTTVAGVSVSCSVQVEVDSPEEVRQHRLNRAKVELDLKLHRLSSLERIKTLAQVRDEWLVFLGADPADLHNDWRVPFAVRLAETGPYAVWVKETGEQVTETVAAMHWRRRRDLAFAADFYKNVIQRFRDAGQYEFAAGVEDMLDRMVRTYGLPRYDLVGEMLHEELLPNSETNPVGHVFGSQADGNAPPGPFQEMFGDVPWNVSAPEPERPSSGGQSTAAASPRTSAEGNRAGRAPGGPDEG